MKNTSMTHRLQVMLFVALVIASIAVAFYAFGFQLRIVGDPGFHARLDEVALFSTMHVVGGGLCLGLGGFQFSKGDSSILATSRQIMYSKGTNSSGY